MKQDFPETRNSLLLRLKDRGDWEAWAEFEQIYRPAIFRLTRRRGLQASDAEDLSQTVLLAVAKKISAWETERQSGSFRAWLLLVARNALLNHFRDRKYNEDLEKAHGIACKEWEQLVDAELRRAKFRQLASKIEQGVATDTWASFWRTAVNQESAASVANDLGLSVAAVYTNKSRVLNKFRELASGLNSQPGR